MLEVTSLRELETAPETSLRDFYGAHAAPGAVAGQAGGDWSKRNGCRRKEARRYRRLGQLGDGDRENCREELRPPPTP